MSVCLSIKDDPFLPKNINRFSDSFSNWPQTKFGHIFTHFVSQAGVYTQEQLLSWKQTDASSYFQAGYVRTVYSFRFDYLRKRYVMLKAKVNPSQQSLDEVNKA